jgi:hypothetical protein
MKTRTITLISMTFLAVILIGAFTLTATGAKELKLKIQWKPNSYILDNGPPDPWIAELRFAPPQPVAGINPSTILLEGMYSPSGPSTIIRHGTERLDVPFTGSDVVSALLTKAPHYGPGTYLIWLEITGKMNDGRAFRGQGYINMTIPDIPPP